MNYSVPFEYIRQKVDVRLTRATVEVFYNGNRICSHPRLYGALLKLTDKYSAQRLENACKRALEYTPRPSLKNIQAILASGQDKLPTEPEPTSSSQYGFTRGADYYDRGKKEC